MWTSFTASWKQTITPQVALRGQSTSIFCLCIIYSIRTNYNYNRHQICTHTVPSVQALCGRGEGGGGGAYPRTRFKYIHVFISTVGGALDRCRTSMGTQTTADSTKRWKTCWWHGMPGAHKGNDRVVCFVYVYFARYYTA